MNRFCFRYRILLKIADDVLSFTQHCNIWTMNVKFFKSSNLCVKSVVNLQGSFWQLLGDSMTNPTYCNMSN